MAATVRLVMMDGGGNEYNVDVNAYSTETDDIKSFAGKYVQFTDDTLVKAQVRGDFEDVDISD